MLIRNLWLPGMLHVEGVPWQEKPSSHGSTALHVEESRQGSMPLHSEPSSQVPLAAVHSEPSGR